VTLATLHVELRGNAAVARLAGEVDASNAPGFAAQLKETVPNSAMALVLDLSETTYIDSSGVHLIFDLADALRRRQQGLQLVVPPETFVADVAAAVGLAGAAGTSATLDEALEAARGSAF
jgi:anti-anti-sigma factor